MATTNSNKSKEAAKKLNEVQRSRRREKQVSKGHPMDVESHDHINW